jgi:imidazolonepropionase-like amidohydrolase
VDDLWTALRLADEFKLRIILLHATEGWKIADEIAKRKIPVLVGPVTTQPDSMETLGATYENADILHRAGVVIAIVTADEHNVRNLPFLAGIAAAYGLPREEALRAITANPAAILGVSGTIGAIREGLSADLVVFDGDPLQPRSRIEHLLIAGRIIPPTSRQTELYERYRNR